MSEDEDHDLDLPLLSNNDDINVYHYVLDLDCKFEERQFEGTITIFCKPADSERSSVSKIILEDSEEKDLSPLDCDEGAAVEQSSSSDENSSYIEKSVEEFKMILDCWDIAVEKVEEITQPNELENRSDIGDEMYMYQTYLACSKCEGMRLEFETDRRCVKIWKKGVKTSADFPNIVKISYRTHSKGHSLKWTKDQDGRECVFTHGHWINNRSLFPSQDVPVAMATWQAVIHVPEGLVVLMSGDKDPVVQSYTHRTGSLSYSYFTTLEMPSSTLALAVGHWRQADIVLDRNTYTGDTQTPISSDSLLPCRLFSPVSHLEQAKTLIGGYMPVCMEAASQMLGPHPFKRLDILVVPSSFCSLGMASPSLMFISQSILSADQEMCVRLAHELSHSWFGLIIGPRDWTEEWLSEGFCTYTEGYLHAAVMQWTEREEEEQLEIRDYLKYKTLEAESNSTQIDLQTLRPNKGDCDYKDGEIKYVKNGMNPEKGFIQVHYLKGYFLLQYLEEQVGQERFHQLLRLFIQTFSRKLVLSQDFLSLYFETFPFLRDRGITEEKIYTEWLDSPGLPMNKSLSVSDNSLAREASAQVEKISSFNKNYASLHWRKKRKVDIASCLKLTQLKGIQVLLMLDHLLGEERVHTDVLDYLQCFYKLTTIQHKWCEIVVKNKSQQHYSDVRRFLIDQQAMGVYLFGELILSGDKDQRKLAHDTFSLIADDMEDGVYKTVHLMVYGT